MPDLDFFADLLITGTILGVDHTSTLAEVEATLGHGCTHALAKDLLSDFGLVEFGWWRRTARDDWAVTYFGAQTHRLLDGLQVEEALTGRYGPFGRRVELGEVRSAVRDRGFELEERPASDESHVEYREPTSMMGLIAHEPDGTVLKILGPVYQRRTAVDAPDEAAVNLIVSLIESGEPGMDAAVERWLAVVPRPSDDIRVARRLRNQIHAVQPCLPALTSPALAEEMRDWVRLKPTLLAPE